MAVLLLSSVATLKAQTPQPPTPYQGGFTDAERTKPNSVKGPIAPATLLLLGLAGSFAGVKIYKNNKKED